VLYQKSTVPSSQFPNPQQPVSKSKAASKPSRPVNQADQYSSSNQKLLSIYSYFIIIYYLISNYALEAISIRHKSLGVLRAFV
jgi:hypothetical protein